MAPEPEPSPEPEDVGTTNISFSGLRSNWGSQGYDGGSDPGSGSNSNISLSEFRGARFDDNTFINYSGSLSIEDNFRGKSFKSFNNFTTSNFNFNIDFSGESDRLYPVSDEASNTATNSETKVAKLFHSNVTYNYPSILMCPQSGDPTIGLQDDAEVWLKLTLAGNLHIQIGIVHKQGQTLWNDVASTALRNRHTTYNDRIAVHSFGYVTHSGHDIETSTKIDELMGKYIPDPSGSNYHNYIGYTAGSGNGFATVSNSYYYLQTNTSYYQSKTSITDYYYLGMKVNYYEKTLTGTINGGTNKINSVQLDGTQLSADDDVYTGMYLYILGTDSNFPSEAIIKSIDYSGTTSIYIGNQHTSGSANLNYGGSSSNVSITFKALGQRLEFQYTDQSFTGPRNIGPNHIILPNKYKTSVSGSSIDIDSWAFFVGDSTSTSNTITAVIQNTKPSPYYDISYKFLEISNRFISDSTTSDYTGPYDVSETQIGLTGDYNIFIGVKVTSSPTYYNDVAIAGVQVLSSTNSVKQTWIFNTTSGDNWETHNTEISGTSSNGFPITPSKARGYVYSTIGTSGAVNKFSYTSSTGSNYTGVEGGISGSTGAFTVGNGTISQVNSSYYLFRETSNSTIYSGTVMRSPSVTLASGDKIRVAHLVVGPSVGTGGATAIMDMSDTLYLGAQPVLPDIENKFVEISNRFIGDTTTSDYTGPYDVSETQIGLSGSYRIYIGVKITASPTYYNDVAIAGVQILTAGDSVKQTWIFNTTSGDNWETYTSQITGSSTVGFPITPYKASTYTYSTITTTYGKERFSYISNTGSNYTGARGGISGSTGTFTVGDGTITQVDASYYLFREASNSTLYSGTVMRSPSVTLAVGDKIRVAHLVVGPNIGTGGATAIMNSNDTLYLGAYAESV